MTPHRGGQEGGPVAKPRLSRDGGGEHIAAMDPSQPIFRVVQAGADQKAQERLRRRAGESRQGRSDTLLTGAKQPLARCTPEPRKNLHDAHCHLGRCELCGDSSDSINSEEVNSSDLLVGHQVGTRFPTRPKPE